MRHSQLASPGRRRAATLARCAGALPPFISIAVFSGGCGTDNTYYTEYVYAAPGGGPATLPDDPGDAGQPLPPKPVPDGGQTPLDAGVEPPSDRLPIEIDTEPAALAVDVLGTLGNRYYLIVSDEQLERMNERYLGGVFGPFFGGDIYTPGGGSGETFVDHLLVTTAGAAPKTADFGKVQVKLVGESTGRPWTPDALPNFKIDSDEFTEGQRIGGVKHFRLNNAIVGSIFREKLTLDLYAKLGYPAPRATYAWVQTSVWGEETAVPYIAVEAYKPAFCKQREAALGGGCVNMWEFAGDLGYGYFGYPESCQFSECDPTRAFEFELDAIETPFGPGYREALSDWLDWDAFHRFQCLSWILATGDDALHNMNNFVLVERADGRFQHLPYSIDISLGQEWYPDVPLAGISMLAQGCQSDPECWEATLTTCESTLADFVAADPVAMLDANYATLEREGMLRDGDEGRYRALSNYLTRRLRELPDELQQNREQGPPPLGGFCDFPFVQCGDYCVLPEECGFCEPEPAPEPRSAPDAGTEASPVEPGGPGACFPLIELYEAEPRQNLR